MKKLITIIFFLICSGIFGQNIMNRIIEFDALQYIAGLISEYYDKYQRVPTTLEELSINTYSETDSNIRGMLIIFERCGYVIQLFPISRNKVEIKLINNTASQYLCIFENNMLYFYENGRLVREYGFIKREGIWRIINERVYPPSNLRFDQDEIIDGFIYF